MSPKVSANSAVCIESNPFSMFFPFMSAAFILSSIFSHDYSDSLHVPFNSFAKIDFSIVSLVFSYSVDFVSLSFTEILSFVVSEILPDPFFYVVRKKTAIGRPFFSKVFTSAGLNVILSLAFVYISIASGQFSVTVFLTSL